jgi:hypothetical protein
MEDLELMGLLRHCSCQVELSLPLPLREIRWREVLQLMNMPIGKVVTLTIYNSCLLWKTADEYHEDSLIFLEPRFRNVP